MGGPQEGRGEEKPHCAPRLVLVCPCICFCADPKSTAVLHPGKNVHHPHLQRLCRAGTTRPRSPGRSAHRGTPRRAPHQLRWGTPLPPPAPVADGAVFQPRRRDPSPGERSQPSPGWRGRGQGVGTLLPSPLRAARSQGSSWPCRCQPRRAHARRLPRSSPQPCSFPALQPYNSSASLRSRTTPLPHSSPVLTNGHSGKPQFRVSAVPISPPMFSHQFKHFMCAVPRCV